MSTLVKEYEKSKSLPLTEEDLSYLKSDNFQPGREETFSILRSHENAGEYVISNSSYAGVIQLSSERLEFKTKVKTNLFYLLSFLKSEKAFLYDPDKTIRISEGVNFFDILGRLFLNELEEIVRQGIIKKYINTEEDLVYLRGKLDLNNQMQNDMKGSPKLACIYDEFTFDNPENQIILKATNLLIGLVRFNDGLREELFNQEYFLRDWVSFVEVTPEDCDRIVFNRINEKYETIIKLSKIILGERYIRSTEKGESVGFNFIVNMNSVFEDFITQIIKDIVHDDPAFKDYNVLDQETLDTLDDDGKLKIRPDIIITNRHSEKNELILDTKYKKYDANSDYYQVIAYALAMPDAKNCCLIYPKSINVEEDNIMVNRDLSLPDRRTRMDKKIRIAIRGIDLLMEDDMSFDEYIGEIKEQVKEKILCLLWEK